MPFPAKDRSAAEDVVARVSRLSMPDDKAQMSSADVIPTLSGGSRDRAQDPNGKNAVPRWNRGANGWHDPEGSHYAFCSDIWNLLEEWGGEW